MALHNARVQEHSIASVLAAYGDGSLTATALVLFMTLPGLAAFYSGLVRTKNVLSVLMQCFAISCVVSVLWLLGGYGLAFGDGGDLQPYIGSISKAWFSGIGRDTLTGTVPEPAFLMFQLHWETWARFGVWLIIGLIIYFGYGRTDERADRDEETAGLALAATIAGTGAAKFTRTYSCDNKTFAAAEFCDIAVTFSPNDTAAANPVLTVTMNRPEARNAFSPDMLVRAADAWKLLDEDPELRVGILTGAEEARARLAAVRRCAGGAVPMQ